jgi:cell wall-associated NlpC family hydrolase
MSVSNRFKVFKSVLALLFVLSFVSCDQKINQEKISELNKQIEEEFAPDKRVAIYDIDVSKDGNSIRIMGETDQMEALTTLVSELEVFGLDVVNDVAILPDTTIGIHPFAVVNNSVANIRSAAKHSAELATQAILGTELKILKIEGDFYRVQTPDKYISWVDHGGVQLMTAEEHEAWSKTPKIIYLKTFGHVYASKTDELDKVGDLVLGALLKMSGKDDNFFEVAYPDGRKGYVKRDEAESYLDWFQELNPSPERLELYARSLMGSPYLWGGTSSKGMDCSGFTKTAFRMNGLIIPRDASQQIVAGKDVDPELTLNSLSKGDLMFFGKKATDSTRQRVTHVAIWLGNDRGEFIHSSGRVKIGSIDPDSPDYDAFNTNRYLGSRRYLGESDPKIVPLAFRN